MFREWQDWWYLKWLHDMGQHLLLPRLFYCKKSSSLNSIIFDVPFMSSNSYEESNVMSSTRRDKARTTISWFQWRQWWRQVHCYHQQGQGKQVYNLRCCVKQHHYQLQKHSRAMENLRKRNFQWKKRINHIRMWLFTMPKYLITNTVRIHSSLLYLKQVFIVKH